MQSPFVKPVSAFAMSVALHALVLSLVVQQSLREPDRTEKAPEAEEKVVIVEFLPPPMAKAPPAPTPPPVPLPATRPDAPVADSLTAVTPVPERAPIAMAAPAPPSSEDWAFAARYPLKNSKGYRYNWGLQVRSMMGTAVEGPDQGVVRFRVEIAPDGTLASLETLWMTSAVAEQLARKAVEQMPPLPPTPTGKPLIFEKTIAFSPFVSDVPPIYKDDCQPDPPSFSNPFAWNGQGQPGRAAKASAEAAEPAMAMEDCLRLLPQDSIEAEAAHDQRQLDRWASSRLGR